MLWDQCRHVYPTYMYKSAVIGVCRIWKQLNAVVRANMIEIIALFIGVVGSLAAPSLPIPEASASSGILYATRSITEDTEMVPSLPLPGSENLDEKAIPLSKLVDRPFSSAGQNLVEKTQIPSQLPGTKNLAEKRIPEPVLRKLYQRYQDD